MKNLMFSADDDDDCSHLVTCNLYSVVVVFGKAGVLD